MFIIETFSDLTFDSENSEKDDTIKVLIAILHLYQGMQEVCSFNAHESKN